MQKVLGVVGWQRELSMLARLEVYSDTIVTLIRVARVGLTEKVRCENRLEGGQGVQGYREHSSQESSEVFQAEGLPLPRARLGAWLHAGGRVGTKGSRW